MSKHDDPLDLSPGNINYLGLLIVDGAAFWSASITWLVSLLGALTIIIFTYRQLGILREKLLTQLARSEKQSQPQTALASLSAGFATTLFDETICQELVNKLHEIKDYEYVTIYLLDEKADFILISANQAAIAIQNAQLYNTARTSADQLMVLHQASREITSSSFDPEKTYSTIHEVAKQLMPCEAYVVSILNEAENIIGGVYMFDKNGRTPAIIIPKDQGLSGSIIRNEEHLLVHDCLESKEIATLPVKHFGNRDHIKAFIAVPMKLGDKALRVISRIIADNIRETDIMGLYGGDKFSILLPDTNIEQAVDLTERLKNLVRNIMIDIDQVKFSNTISVGVSYLG